MNQTEIAKACCSESTGHPHAALMAEYAKDALTNAEPWELWEHRQGRSPTWHDLSGHPQWDTWRVYRRKPAPIPTRVINGFTVPAPLSASLLMGDKYAVASLDTADWYAFAQWQGDTVDKRWLERGLLFIDPEHAIANAKAMCGIDPKWSQE